jgi:hypothetical protein
LRNQVISYSKTMPPLQQFLRPTSFGHTVGGGYEFGTSAHRRAGLRPMQVSACCPGRETIWWVVVGPVRDVTNTTLTSSILLGKTKDTGNPWGTARRYLPLPLAFSAGSGTRRGVVPDQSPNCCTGC